MSRWLFIEPGRIGDWVVATVAARLFTEKTGAEIDWAIRGEVAPLLDRATAFNKALVIPDGIGLRVLPGLISGVLNNKKKYDGCCVLSQGRSGALIAAMTKAKRKCGYLNFVDPYNESTPSRDCDIDGNCFKYNPYAEHLLARALKPLGNIAPEFRFDEMSGMAEFHPRLSPSSEDAGKASGILAKAGINDTHEYILISAGSRWSYKTWPTERWRTLVNTFCKRGVHVLATGGPSDEDKFRTIKKTITSPLFHIAKPLALPAYAALVKSSSVLVCHDSGPMHIASAVGANIVAIYGPTDPLVTGPLADSGKVKIVQANSSVCAPCLIPAEDPHKGKVCISEDHKCMNDISVEQVARAIEEFLA